MNNSSCFITRTPTRRALGFFSLAFLVVLLFTLATGLIWCQPPVNSHTTAASPVGTWVSADAWERGSSAADTVIEITADGLLLITPGDFSALYRYEDDTLHLLDINGEYGEFTPDDTASPAVTQSYKCIIAGDHMSFYGQITGLPYYHGRTHLIRISSETGLSADDIAALY